MSISPHSSLFTSHRLILRHRRTHQISSAPPDEDILFYTAGADTLFAADSVCFSCLMELSVPRAQSEYCGQPQSINDLRFAL